MNSPLDDLGNALTKIDVFLPAEEYIENLLQLICTNLDYFFAVVVEVDERGIWRMLSTYNLPQDLEQVGKENFQTLLPQPDTSLESEGIVVLKYPIPAGHPGNWPDLLEHHKIQMIVAIPICNKDLTIGTLALFTPELRHLSDQEIHTLKQLSITISMTMARKKHVEQLNQKTKVLEQEILRHQQTERELEEKVQTFRSLLEKSSDAIVILDLSEKVKYRSPSYKRMLGYEPEEMTPGLFDRIHPEEIQAVQEVLTRILSKPGSVVQMDVRVRHKLGDWLDIEATGYNLIDDPMMKGIVVNFRDITERKRTEEKLRQNRNFVNTVLRAIPTPLFAKDKEGRYTFANSAFNEFFGLEPETVIGKTVFECWDSVDARIYHKRDLELMAEDDLQRYEHVLKNAKGEAREVMFQKACFHDADGAVAGLVGTFFDLTEQKRIERALRESEEKYRTLVEKSLQGVVIAQASPTRLRFANEPLTQIVGYSVKELLAFTPEQLALLIHPDDRYAFFKNFNDRISGKAVPQAREYRAIRKDGEMRWVLSFSNLIEFDKEPSTLTFFIDITEQKKAEQALRETEERYRNFVQNFQGIAFRGQLNDVPIFFHGAVTEITGYTEKEFLQGQPTWDQIIHPDDFPLMRGREELRTIPDYSTEREYRIIRKNGGIRWLHEIIRNINDESGKPKFIQGAIYDITERKKVDEDLKASKARYKELAESITDLFFAMDSDLRYTYWNKPLQQLTGIPATAALGKTFPDLYPCVKESKRIKNLFLKVLKTQQPQSIIAKCFIKAKHYFHEINAYPAQNGLSVFVKDITRRKRAELIQSVLLSISRATSMSRNLEELLSIIQQQLGTLIDTTNFYVALYDKNTDLYTFPFYVDEYDRLEDFSPKQLHKSLTDYVRRTGKPILVDKAVFQRLVAKNEIELVGTYSPIWLGVPLKTIQGVMGVVAVQSYQDQSLYTEEDLELMTFVSGNIAMAIQRKQNEEALRTSEEKFRTYVSFAPHAIYITDSQNRTIEVNKAACRLTGYSEAELVNMPVSRHIDPDSVQTGLNLLAELTKTGQVNGEIKIKRKDGSVFWGAVDAVMLLESRFMIFCSDISERIKIQQELREERDFAESLIKTAQAIVLVLDPQARIVRFNPYMEKISGYKLSEVRGKNWITTFLPKRDQQKIKQLFSRAINGIQTKGNINPIVIRDGREREIEWYDKTLMDANENVIGLLVIGQDVTNREKLEQEIRKAARLESIGILAGGIAHDFNNLLTAILGNISLVKIDLAPQSDSFEILTDAEKASLRAQELTQQLLTFSRGGKPIKKLTTVTDLIKDSVRFALRGSNVRCYYSVPEELWPVEIDEGQINQVLNNLIINADQAMPEGGIIRVKAENYLLKPEHAVPLKEGCYLKITIKDYGIGIAPEFQQKIFDPYFTTKQKGSGLGLATSYSIIKSHGGHISVESKLGRGATFFIFLPAFPEKKLPEKPVPDKTIGGKGKILVMDDEEFIRTTLTKMLNRIGYQVTAVEEGTRAIELYQEAMNSNDPFMLVIMDLTIPGGMGGKETIKKLVELNPEVKAIVSSGYSNDPIMANFKDYGFCGFITKPYRIKELSEILSALVKPT